MNDHLAVRRQTKPRVTQLAVFCAIIGVAEIALGFESAFLERNFIF